MKKTKVLLVENGCGDFGAIEFQNNHGGTPVKDILADLDKYASEDEMYYLHAHEFEGDIDPKFIEFIKRNIQDYDDSKNTTFYLENEIVE